MKKTKFLITSLLILICTFLQAQSKWFVSPLVSVATIGNKDNDKINWGGKTNLTLGRYVGEFAKNAKGARLRADIFGEYYYFSDNSIYSTAALLTAHGKDDKIYDAISLGFGIQKREICKKYEFIIPLRMTFGTYIYKDIMSLGFDASVNLNLSDFWRGSPISLGLFLGIGL